MTDRDHEDLPDPERARAAGYTVYEIEPGSWAYRFPNGVARGVGLPTMAAAWEAAGRSWRVNYGFFER